MATLQPQQHYLHPRISYSPKLLHFKNPNSVSYSRKLLCFKKIYGFSRSSHSRSNCFHECLPLCQFSKKSAEIEPLSKEQCESMDENERPPFDINLAVILAGFAFEAYTGPPENVGKREVDAANCQTVFLSESFVREIYDGQLFIKLKKGHNFPAMDLWGTSDPYVVLQLDGQVLKSKTKWGTKEPTWNEEFVLNIKLSPSKILQVAAWDANLVSPPKRMGNSGIDLDPVCDGNSHALVVDLEGMGGGGKIELEIKYKSFEKIDQEKQWWRIPIVTEFLEKYGFDNLMRTVLGSETVQARQFVEFAFGQIKTLNNEYLQKNWFSNRKEGKTYLGDLTTESGRTSELKSVPGGSNDESEKEIGNQTEQDTESSVVDNEGTQVGQSFPSDQQFWKILADTVNDNVVQRFGLSAPKTIKWDGFDLLNKIGSQSRKNAEAVYIESGLATPEDRDVDNADVPLSPNANQSSLANIKKVTQELLQQTDAVLGALMVLNATVSKISKGAGLLQKNDGSANASSESENDISEISEGGMSMSTSDMLILDEKKAEEMRALFSSAESAMEAWAMLATAVGHPSFIESEFKKICFLDNPSTDTQVALWRDSARKRLVVAFRGTEQARWKDLMTDLMLVPAGLNPERIDGDFKQEVQVHSGFLSAYDSVRTRIIRFIKQVVGYISDDDHQLLSKWNVYVTGHSLGGALASLLALELASGQLAKHGAISVTMYNFGSPRVGNKKFAELYNEKVKDSWRVVNHRDIIPTVPRLMGYCHVAQPIYLAAGDLENALENMSLMADGYQGDVLGESTPDVLISEFMKGEKELIEKILNTEINIFLSIRDGSALMQHMEDFYYVTLLESVRLNYQTVGMSRQNEEKSLSIG